MADKAKTPTQKKTWQEPRVERTADMREVRNGIVVGTGRESGVFYDS